MKEVVPMAMVFYDPTKDSVAHIFGSGTEYSPSPRISYYGNGQIVSPTDKAPTRYFTDGASRPDLNRLNEETFREHNGVFHDRVNRGTGF